MGSCKAEARYSAINFLFMTLRIDGIGMYGHAYPSSERSTIPLSNNEVGGAVPTHTGPPCEAEGTAGARRQLRQRWMIGGDRRFAHLRVPPSVLFLLPLSSPPFSLLEGHPAHHHLSPTPAPSAPLAPLLPPPSVSPKPNRRRMSSRGPS